jgi:hypothetical protein
LFQSSCTCRLALSHCFKPNQILNQGKLSYISVGWLVGWLKLAGWLWFGVGSWGFDLIDFVPVFQNLHGKYFFLLFWETTHVF